MMGSFRRISEVRSREAYTQTIIKRIPLYKNSINFYINKCIHILFKILYIKTWPGLIESILFDAKICK